MVGRKAAANGSPDSTQTSLRAIARQPGGRSVTRPKRSGGEARMAEGLRASGVAARHFEPMDDWSGRVDERGGQGELRGVLTDAIDALPPDYRTALVLHEVEGLSSPDISQALGIGLAAVKLRVHRSRLFVRKHLSEHLEPA